MTRTLCVLSAIALLLVLIGASASFQTWRPADPAYSWNFPRDHWSHPDFRTEWWYFTGHLKTSETPPQDLAYQFTFFRSGMAIPTLDLESDWNSGQFIMGHAAISVPATGRHEFSELVYRETPIFGEFGDYPDPTIVWSLAPPGTADKWTLRWNGAGFDFRMKDQRKGFSLELTTVPSKPAVFQGPGGFSQKSEDKSSGSMYYSFTKLRTEGTVTIDEQTYQVDGWSWMDKEFSSSMLSRNQVGWDWFGLQLDDGRELMLYRLRNPEGETDFARATLTLEDGSARYFSGTEWSARPVRWWQSEDSEIRYPLAWRISIPAVSIRIRIEPSLLDQENRSTLIPNLNYWEGSVQVLSEEGNVTGRGFAELTGYGEGTRPPL